MFKFFNKLIFEKNVMANIKNEDILIYNTDSVYLEHVENRYEGRINNINWGNLNKFAYSTQSGHPFHGKVDSWSVATRGV